MRSDVTLSRGTQWRETHRGVIKRDDINARYSRLSSTFAGKGERRWSCLAIVQRSAESDRKVVSREKENETATINSSSRDGISTNSFTHTEFGVRCTRDYGLFRISFRATSFVAHNAVSSCGCTFRGVRRCICTPSGVLSAVSFDSSFQRHRARRSTNLNPIPRIRKRSRSRLPLPSSSFDSS